MTNSDPWPTDEELQSGSVAVPFGSNIPPGGIIAWFSESVAAPKGWAICNGNAVVGSNGRTYLTPDLRDVFLRGAARGQLTPAGTPRARLPGYDDYTIQHVHSHGTLTGGFIGGTQRFNADQNDAYGPVSSYTHQHSISDDTLNAKIPLLPKHWSIQYIIKLP